LPKKLYILCILAVLSFTYSCKYTKYVPEGKSILWENKIVLDSSKNASSAAYNILKQRPTPHYWILAPNLAIYNWGNGTDSSFFSKIGDPPVVFDSKKAEAGALQLQNYYFNKGYFNATSDFKVRPKEKKRWVYVDYSISRGNRYFIKEYKVNTQNSRLSSIYNTFKDQSVVIEGDPYDAAILNQERDRLTALFKDHGFYTFSRNFIQFKADTFVKGDFVNLEMVILPPSSKNGDTSINNTHERYRFSNIYIRPDYSYREFNHPSDTLGFRDYQIVFDSLQYKPRYLTDAIHLEKGEYYKNYQVKRTYSHLNSYKAFNLTEISFSKAGRDSIGPLLDAYVNISPETDKTFNIESEATTTSGNYGINLSVGWVSRNIFNGGEEFQLKFNSGIEFQSGLSDQGTSQTYEIGGEASLRLPRFVLPFNTVGLVPKRMRPTSTISIFAGRVLRNEFDRENIGGRLSYGWNENSRKNHQFDLADISYSRLFDLNSDFLAGLSNIEAIAFEPALTSVSRYIFTYNDQSKRGRKNHNFFKGTIESAGITLSLLENNTGIGTNEVGIDRIGGVPYFQYIKLEADYRYYWNITPNTSWVNRAYLGTIRPYGNSIDSTGVGSDVRYAPFNKYFFIGGSNDLRAWPAYRLGPGSRFNTDYDSQTVNDSSFALGTIKFLFNSEIRFPLFSFVNGAFFIDAGNIWLNGGLEDEETDFVWNDVFDELAIGTGFGLRLDFDFFIVRFDIAAKVRDPGRNSINDPWVINNKPFQNLTYNIALGYPF
jgi:outer membrane protein assembly factor BamA